MKTYDLVVIGSGPGGEKAAAKAAYFGHSVALIEKSNKYGGAGVNTGTLPSKTLKETALYFSGKFERGLYGVDKKLEHDVNIKAFMYRKDHVVTSEGAAIAHNLELHKIDVLHGAASFDDPHTLRVVAEGKDDVIVRGENIIIATGSYPFHPPNLPIDGVRVHDSDTILEIDHIPLSLCVLGAGVIGCEYATIFSTSGAEVFLVNRVSEILPFVDDEVAHHLVELMERGGIQPFFEASVAKIDVPDSPVEPLAIHLESGQVIKADMFLFAAGRSGNTGSLKLENAGVKVGRRELIEVDDDYRTSVKHIFAVGDVIGFPSLASTSMDQGRAAVAHIFDLHDLEHIAPVFPYGIYTIPEISMVGMSEEDATKEGIEYAVGRARHKDMPRGKIMGAEDGFMKLVFRRDNKVIIGVHIIGHLASELVHYGVTLVENKKTLDDVITRIFNFPTLHDLYKYASYDGLGNLAGHKVKE